MRVLKPGDLIADRYRIDTVIARGGMGAVYRATDERIGRAVAIKVMLRELSGDRISIARFEREAMATARLDHPGVVSVLDFGTTPEGVSYLVMEHVSGRTLAEMLEQGRLAPSRAVDIVEQALGALAAAHAVGIVHRDLKPGNLMIVPAGAGGREIVKLFDFGVAQLKSGAAYTKLTQAGAMLGTPAFMSPEQARGEPCDPRTDVYAMGLVLWCALTGVRPFKGADLAALLVAVQNEVPPRADSVVAEVPREIASIVARALEKRAEDRWQSVAELASALVAARISTPPARASEQPGANVSTLPMMPPPSSIEPQASPPPAVAVLQPAEPDRPLWPYVLAALIVLGLAGGALVIGLVAIGIVELSDSELPMPPYPSSPDPAPVPVPTVPALAEPREEEQGPEMPLVDMPLAADPTAPVGQDICGRAFDCCYAYQERVEDLEEACDDLLGESPADDADCIAQMAVWRAGSIEEETPLDECL